MGVETFSFSSSSLGAELTLIRRLVTFDWDSTLELDARRRPEGVPGTAGRVVEDRPSADSALGAVGVGVPEIDDRDIFEAGGPMLPTALPAADDAALTRTLLFNAPILARGAPEGVSASLRSDPSLEMSDRAEGGRTEEGVEKAVDSRRLATLEGCAGVAPPVPRTPCLRLT